MEKSQFIKNFAEQFDYTDESNIHFETRFRDLDEWSSLNALAIMNMIEKKYGVIIKADELKNTNTVKELFEMMVSKNQNL